MTRAVRIVVVLIAAAMLHAPGVRAQSIQITPHARRVLVCSARCAFNEDVALQSAV
jgi:hypothetical protein